MTNSQKEGIQGGKVQVKGLAFNENRNLPPNTDLQALAGAFSNKVEKIASSIPIPAEYLHRQAGHHPLLQ